VLATLPGDVRVVSKFWPADPARLSSGMLLELARQEGVAAAFLKALELERGDLGDSALLALLDGAGVPLEKQRAALTDEKQKLGEVLQEDIRRGQAERLPPPPVFLLNGYLMDDGALKISRMVEYVERLREGQPLVQGSDYFLMEK
jgi:hypothetical protein